MNELILPMLRLKINTAIKLFVLFCGLSGAATAQYRLDDFIRAAVKNNPSINETRRLIEGNMLDRKLIAAQQSLPQISLTANYLFAPYFNNNGKFITTDPGPDAIGYDIGLSNGGLYSALVNVEKNIFNGGVIDALEMQNTINERAQQYGMRDQEHSLRKQVADLYLAALQSAKIRALSDETVKLFDEQLAVTEAFVRQGLAKETDYLLLRIEADNQRMIHSAAVADERGNLIALFSLCGMNDTSVVALEAVSLDPVAEPAASQFDGKFVNDSLMNSVAQTLSENKYLPQVKLFFNTGLNAVGIDGIEKKLGLSAGVDVLLPLYDGGQRSLTRQQSILREKSIRDYRDYFELQLAGRRKSALLQIELARNNLDRIDRQIDAYNNVLGLSKNQLRQGQVSMIEYLTILKNFIDLRKSKITMEINRQIQINNFNYWNW
jgi:outer membrane protein TolC